MPRLQSKRWCFTINNPTPEDYAKLNGSVDLCTYLVFADEVGDNGTPHIQGFVVFKSNKGLTAVRRLYPRGHFEIARGTNQQASDYATKDGTNVVEHGQIPGPAGRTNRYDEFRDWVLAQPSKPNAASVALHFPSIFLNSGRVQAFIDAIYPTPPPEITDYRPYQSILADILNGGPDSRKIYFVVDPHGNSGKSWFAHRYFLSRPDDVQILSAGRRDDLAFAIDERKRVFLFDLPRSTSEFLQYSILEQLKNGLVFSSKYESRMKLVPPSHVVVFMNEYPDMTKLSADRYEVLVWYHNP